MYIIAVIEICFKFDYIYWFIHLIEWQFLKSCYCVIIWTWVHHSVQMLWCMLPEGAMHAKSIMCFFFSFHLYLWAHHIEVLKSLICFDVCELMCFRKTRLSIWSGWLFVGWKETSNTDKSGSINTYQCFSCFTWSKWRKLGHHLWISRPSITLPLMWHLSLWKLILSLYMQDSHVSICLPSMRDCFKVNGSIKPVGLP